MIERLRVRIPAGAAGEFFFSRVKFVGWPLFGVRSTPSLQQWHVKDPGHSVRTPDGRLHLNTQTPVTQQSRSGLTMPLCRHSIGTYQETSSHATRQGTTQPQSSQLVEPLWTDPGLKNGISVRQLIST